jgi:hypothetical protein
MSKSLRIEAIIREYYAERAKKKWLSLKGHAFSYLSSVEGLKNFSASLDPIAVEQLCDAYFIDVVRYKEYHSTPDKPDIKPFSEDWAFHLHSEHSGKRVKFSKIAALTVKWLLKYHPIVLQLDKGVSVSSLPSQERRTASFINEAFALSYSLDIIKVEFSKIDPKECEDLLYHFKYRNYDERHFFLLYEYLRKKYS